MFPCASVATRYGVVSEKGLCCTRRNELDELREKLFIMYLKEW